MLFNNNSSLICWVSIKNSDTRLPALYNLDSLMLTLKQSSPDVNPAIHWGCNFHLILSGLKDGLETATLLGKASLSKGVNPLLREALILITFCKPSLVKWFLFCIII